MTTIQQLPVAPTLSSTDQLLISQSGETTTTTVAQLLANTQPLITIATGTLLGRASVLPGGPEALGIGHGLILQSGTLAADTSTLATAANAILSGVPTAPTPPVGDASAAVATTAFVAAATASVVMPLAGAGLRRAGTTLSVNLAGLDGGAATVQTAAGVTRSLASLATEQQNPRNFGARGDGVADDTAAIRALSLAGGGTIPPGTYNTTLDASAFTNGRLHGSGRVRDVNSLLRAPSVATIASKPGGSADESSIGPAFNGDFSRSHLAFEHHVIDSPGGHTLGVPGPNSYLCNPQTAAIYGYVYNSSGYNSASGDNSSRTGLTASRIKFDQYGQGDLVAYNASGFVASTLPGATHFLANPAIKLFNGDLRAGADGTYLNAIDIVVNDQGHDIAGAGSVVSLNRTNDTGNLGVSWAGYRAQSIGPKPIDAHVSTSGAVDVSIDLVGATSPIKGAIAMKANDRLYLNASNPDAHVLPNTLVPGTEWLEYDPANGAQFVVGSAPVAQFNSSGGRLRASPAATDNSTAIATTAFVRAQGFVGSPSTHLFPAVDYGARFDGISDDAPGIQAAINAARAVGGGRVLLPGRKGMLGTGLVIDHPAIGIIGTGASTLDDYTAQTYLSGRAGTRLVWNGPLGGTMLTLQLNAALNGSAIQLKGCDIAGILWDCNAGVDAHGLTNRGAATAVATWFGWDSDHDIYFMNPALIGVRYETCQGITARIYGSCFAVASASALQLAGSTRTGTSVYGNTSLNSFPVVRVGIINGDGVAFHETDHNYLATVDVIRAAGGTGRGIVFAGARDQPPGGPINAFCAYMNRIVYCNTNGAPIVCEGTDTPGVIAASFGNIIEWLDGSNTTPLPTKGIGASVFYADDSGYTYNPLIVGPVFSNQSGQLTSGGIQSQLAGETVAVWHSGTAHFRLYASDYYTIWRFGVNAATGTLEISPDRNLHGPAQLSVGGGAGLHVDGAVVANGSGQFNNVTVASPSNTHSVGIATNVGSGYLNPLAQVGDNFLSFSAGAIDTGGLVIGPWASHGYGLRLAADGTATVNSSPVWTAATLTNVGQLTNNTGYLTAATQPIATVTSRGAVKVGSGLTVAADGTLATLAQPAATTTAPGQVKVGTGLIVATDGTLATAAPPVATTTTPGQVKIGVGLTVAADGTVAVVTQPVATSGVAGTVKIGTGLTVATDGTIATTAQPVATATTPGQVKVGTGLNVAVDGTIAAATQPIATATTTGLVKAGSGLSVAPDGTLATTAQPVATVSAPGLVKIGGGLTVAVDGTLAAVTQPIASAAIAGAVKVGGGLSVAADGTLAAVVSTLAALRALPWAALADGATLSVAAYAVRGDGGGGMFTWNAGSTAIDDGGTALNPTGNAGVGRWLRQLVLGRVTPQMFGAKADGVTNDSAAFNAALKIGRVTVPFASYLVSSLVLTNGCEMEGGAGLGYSGDTAATALVRPILIAASGASSILNAAGVKDFSLSGLFLDGNNTGCDGITAGSTQMTLNRVTVVRCNNGLGSASASDVYTHIATLIDCQFANCTNGVANLIDSAMLAGAVSACQYGLWLSSGAAANNFIGVRYEWCTQHNIHIFQAQKNQFIGGLVDRGYVAGAYLAGAADIHFVGVQFSRNGRNNDATWLGNSHLVLDSNNASIAVTNPIWSTGRDDDGTGALTPQFGITYNNANDRITITSGDGSGFVAGFARGAEPTNYVLRDVSGAGDSIVTAARPYLRGGTAAHTVQTRNSANITTGLTSTIAMGQSALTSGYTAYSRELKLYATDFSTGSSYAARFNLTFYYDTTAHLPSVSAAYGEVGGAGVFQFSNVTGTLRLSITGLSSDGGSFTLNVKNGGTAGNYGVWAELL